jgi:AcrR family transcriptional regulator
MEGRRERKKRETGERIALAAAGLFAERGYAAVSVIEVAQVADVSEQTVYNHFPSKEDLVFDRSAELDAALKDAITGRSAATAAATAIRPVLHTLLDRTARIPREDQRGGIARLAAEDPSLQRAVLARTRGHAQTMALALAAGRTPTAQQQIAGWALAGVLQLLLEELGAAQVRGEDPAATSKRLRVEVNRMLKSLAVLG